MTGPSPNPPVVLGVVSDGFPLVGACHEFGLCGLHWCVGLFENGCNTPRVPRGVCTQTEVQESENQVTGYEHTERGVVELVDLETQGDPPPPMNFQGQSDLGECLQKLRKARMLIGHGNIQITRKA